uniref:Uncharacterized protein n=1 Tax=Ditylenchus dipsaci TaxID=166011 RepID=A0A915EVF4_9BILA
MYGSDECPVFHNLQKRHFQVFILQQTSVDKQIFQNSSSKICFGRPVDAFVKQDLMYYFSRARPRAFQAPLLDLNSQSNSTSTTTTTTTTTTTSPPPAPEEPSGGEEEDVVGGGAGAGAVVPTSPRTPENNIQSPPTNNQNAQANPSQPAAANLAASAAPVPSPAAAGSAGVAANNPITPVASPAVAASSGAAKAQNPAAASALAQARALEADPAIASSFRVADTPSFGGLAGGGGAACFTADTIVKTWPAGESKRMDELRIGDWIMSVDADAHIDGTSLGWVRMSGVVVCQKQVGLVCQRLQLDGGQVIRLTAKHLIYICSQQAQLASKQAILAEQVQVDDCLWVMEHLENGEYQLVKKKVVDVSVVLERGIYAPITSNGDILVNNVLASCYVLIQHNILQQSFVKMLKEWSWLRWMYSVKNLDESQHLLPFGTQTLVDLMAYLIPIK